LWVVDVPRRKFRMLFLLSEDRVIKSWVRHSLLIVENCARRGYSVSLTVEDPVNCSYLLGFLLIHVVCPLPMVALLGGVEGTHSRHLCIMGEAPLVAMVFGFRIGFCSEIIFPVKLLLYLGFASMYK